MTRTVDDFLDHIVASQDGKPIKRKHTMSIPEKNIIKKWWTQIYGCGYEDARDDGPEAAKRRTHQRVKRMKEHAD